MGGRHSAVAALGKMLQSRVTDHTGRARDQNVLGHLGSSSLASSDR
jgi:hypothetical protein